MAVFAARDVLKKWTETRVDQAVASIDIVVEDWKRDNDVTGLQSALIDTIDVLSVIAFDQNVVAAISDVPFDELIALAILKEAEERPHVATKGGAFLAAYTADMLDRIGEVFDSEWLPDIRHGVKRRRVLADAHAAMYGSKEQKIQRWRDQCLAYDHFFKATGKKTLAKEDAAEQCGVSVRAIERSLKKRRERKI